MTKVNTVGKIVNKCFQYLQFKVHLTSQFFFSLKKFCMLWWLFIWKKFLILSNLFYAPLMYGKSYWNRRHFGSRPCFKGQGSGDYCDVTSRTRQSVFRAISYSLLVYVWKVTSILVANSRNMSHRYMVGGCSIVRRSDSGIAL